MPKKKLNIIKIGGNIINNDKALADFLTHFATLKGDKILVHGGGIKASETLEKMGITPKMIDGRRITDAKTLQVVTMVYAGLLNKNIVAQLQTKNCQAIGLSGADANAITAYQKPVAKIDYGFIGIPNEVNANGISHLLSGGMTPVFCALTHDKKGQLFNTNADTIAGSLAVGLVKKYEVSLWYLFEKQGVLKDITNENSVIELIDSKIYETLKKDGTIVHGMLPKMENCFNALQAGVSEVKIAHADALKNTHQKYTTLKI